MKKESVRYQYKEGHEKQIIPRIERFCAYTERCEFDVVKKLKEWNVPEHFFEEILSSLRESNFIHQNRYGESFVRGKFKLKGWGKQKIKSHLVLKQIDEQIIDEAMTEIDDTAYLSKLDHILSGKYKTLKDDDIFFKRSKLYKFAIQKGYESPLIIQWLDEHLKS